VHTESEMEQRRGHGEGVIWKGVAATEYQHRVLIAHLISSIGGARIAFGCAPGERDGLEERDLGRDSFPTRRRQRRSAAALAGAYLRLGARTSEKTSRAKEYLAMSSSWHGYSGAGSVG
jgi:hypothetical protein